MNSVTIKKDPTIVLIIVALAMALPMAGVLSIVYLKLQPIWLIAPVITLVLLGWFALRTVRRTLEKAGGLPELGHDKENKEERAALLAECLKQAEARINVATSSIKQKLALEQLDETSARLLSNVKDALELGLSFATEEETSPIHLDKLTQYVSEFYGKALAKKKCVSLCLLVDPKLPSAIVAPPSHIANLICSLLDNALRHTQDGEINLTITGKQYSTDKTQCLLEIQCCDTGTGIKGSKLELIREELQGEISIIEFHALGSGLRTVKSICDQRNGTVTIENRTKKGSIVTATLTVGVTEPAQEIPALPKMVKAMTSSQAAFFTIGKVTEFLGISLVPTGTLVSFKGNIFIEGEYLLKGAHGEIEAIPEKERHIVLLRHDEVSAKSDLKRIGFSRFVTMPLTSHACIKILTDKHAPHEHDDDSYKHPRVRVADELPVR